MMNSVCNNKIKILHFCIADKIGGIEVFIKSIIENVNNNEFEIGVLSNTENYVFKDVFERNNIKVYVMPSIKKYFKHKTFLIEVMKNYDIIHFHKNSASNILGYSIAKNLGKKIVTHSHNTMPSSGRITRLLHSINKNKLNKLSGYKLACSNLAGKWLFNDDNFTIINNGINVEKFKFNSEVRRKLRTQFEIETKDIVIGHVGRFNDQKNHMFLLNVFEKLDNYGSYKLVLIGDGVSENEIKRVVSEKKLDTKVLFLGQVENVSDYYNMMDLFVFPSIFEGFPISLVEVAANGLPAIISSAVTNEAILNSNMYQLDLSLGEEMWAKYIFDNNLENNRDLDGYLEVEKNGYSFGMSMKKIEKIYKECMQDE